MAKIQDMILYALEEEYKAANQIINNVERAHAFYELTQAYVAAIKTQGNIAVTTTSAPEENTVEEPKVVRTRKSNKKQIQAQPEPAVAKEPAVEDVQQQKSVVEDIPLQDIQTEDTLSENVPQVIEVETSPVEQTDTAANKWSNEAMIEMEEELAEFNAICSELEEFSDPTATLNNLIAQATDGKAKCEQDVSPSNIREIIAYIRAMQNDAYNQENMITEE